MAFPQLKGKHRESALFSPKNYVDYYLKIHNFKKKNFPENIIFCYDRKLFNYVCKNYKLKHIEGFSSMYEHFYSIGETKNRVGIIALFGIGAPVAVVIIEEFIAAGAKRFISIGTAGSLQPNIKLGSIIICDKAIRDEGTSHHYLPRSKFSYASKPMLRKIERVLKKLNTKYARGATWTIDAPYRETIAEVRQYKKEGVLTVEMEAAAIFAVAKYRGVEAGAIFTVSDYLSEAKWRPKFHLTKEHLARIFEVAKEVLLN